MQSANPLETQDKTKSVLVIGRSERVLRKTVDLVRRNGRTAGATNDFENVLALFDAAALDIVVFGGMVPPTTKETLRTQLSEANPTITFVQGLAGIPGLIAAQVEAAIVPRRLEPGSIEYDRHNRTVTISLQSPEHVRLTAFWGTAFVPPDPESASEVIFDDTLEPGRHTVPLPRSVPTVASFLVVTAGEEVHPFEVGPMPPGTTMAVPLRVSTPGAGEGTDRPADRHSRIDAFTN
jgi:hypothetical protein